MVDCASWVAVNGVDSAVVRLYSDAADSPVSDPVYFDRGYGWIHTYRGLRAGEHLTLKAEKSCLPLNLRESASVRVAELPALRAPGIL